MNTHHKSLTELICCNTNVLMGLNGGIVHYVTCYHSKSQQKEEKRAFENISEALLKRLKNQVCITMPSIFGFLFLLTIFFTGRQ